MSYSGSMTRVPRYHTLADQLRAGILSGRYVVPAALLNKHLSSSTFDDPTGIGELLRKLAIIAHEPLPEQRLHDTDLIESVFQAG